MGVEDKYKGLEKEDINRFHELVLLIGTVEENLCKKIDSISYVEVGNGTKSKKRINELMLELHEATFTPRTLRKIKQNFITLWKRSPVIAFVITAIFTILMYWAGGKVVYGFETMISIKESVDTIRIKQDETFIKNKTQDSILNLKMDKQSGK